MYQNSNNSAGSDICFESLLKNKFCGFEYWWNRTSDSVLPTALKLIMVISTDTLPGTWVALCSLIVLEHWTIIPLLLFLFFVITLKGSVRQRRKFPSQISSRNCEGRCLPGASNDLSRSLQSIMHRPCIWRHVWWVEQLILVSDALGTAQNKQVQALSYLQLPL